MLLISSSLTGLTVLTWLGAFGRLLPPPRRRAVPWTGAEVLFVFFVVGVVWPEVGYAVLGGAGSGGDGLATRHVAALVLVFPFQIATVVLLLRQVSGTRAYQLGLTTHRFAGDCKLGVLAWLYLTPAAYGVYFLAAWLLGGAEDHPLTKLMHGKPAPWEWLLLLGSAVVAAPFLEELLFRGVLQPWLTRSLWGPAVVVAVAVALTLLPWWLEAVAKKGADPFALPGPGVFVLTAAPGCLLAPALVRRWLPDAAAVRAVYSQALLFAAVHPAWPSALPLFVLALGLGYLAYRTQSLVAPVLTHSLFNAVACVMLLSHPSH